VLLPTRGISFERALITVGADALTLLRAPTSVSGLWDRFNTARSRSDDTERITFDWFSLALASLFAIGSIEWTSEGYLRRSDVPA
jgi:hypothetical protein